ncbi:hypothetical protein [Azomonas macrocytogenes]|uniref:Uncharacterized protein n=1 Tax=Azomonas macrocytogenes TaxID=69962 RepID=A0A839T5R9_AZOMA|nr:hypothetical protein [Azomonas macrocytogenes]MBB3104438.1 hypothetical protein [Azomonas macrocytogenes]
MLSEQIVPGSFAFARDYLVDHELDLSELDARGIPALIAEKPMRKRDERLRVPRGRHLPLSGGQDTGE